jgi:hypothetical protein
MNTSGDSGSLVAILLIAFVLGIALLIASAVGGLAISVFDQVGTQLVR